MSRAPSPAVRAFAMVPSRPRDGTVRHGAPRFARKEDGADG